MNKTAKKRNHLAPLLVAAGLLLPVGASAQGGVFGRGDKDVGSNRHSGMLRDSETALTLSNQHFGNPIGGDVTNQLFGNHIGADDITNQTFGAPLGSGMLIMLAAGAGYATIKSRKRNKKNNKQIKRRQQQ